MDTAFDPEEVLADTVASYPPGHFDGVTRLLHAYVTRLAEHAALLDEANIFVEAATVGSLAERLDQLKKAMEVRQRATVALEEAADLAAALGLLPGDDRSRRPWLH